MALISCDDPSGLTVVDDLDSVEVESIRVLVPSQNVAPGESVQATAEVLDPAGLPLTDVTVEWSVTDLEVATVSDAGLIRGSSPGVIELSASAYDVADTVRFSVASIYADTALVLTPSEDGEARLYTELLGGVHFEITVTGERGVPERNARVHYQESDGRVFIGAQGLAEHHRTVFVRGNLASTFDTIATGGLTLAPVPRTADQADIVVPITSDVIRGMGHVRITLPVGIPSSEGPAVAAIGWKNAVVIQDWTADAGECVLISDLTERLSVALAEVRQSDRQMVSVGFFGSAGRSGTTVLETASVLSSPSSGGSATHELTTEDLKKLAEVEYGIDRTHLEAPTGLVRAVVEEHELVPTAVSEGVGVPILYAIDPFDDRCAGRIPATVSWEEVPSSILAGDTVTLTTRVLSEWGTNVDDAEVQFEVVDGGGSFLDTSVSTDSAGYARVHWNAPADEGDVVLSAQVSTDPGSSSAHSLVTVSVRPPPAGLQVLQVSAGYRHTCAIDLDQRVLCWGENLVGQLGTGDTRLRDKPAYVVTEERFLEVSAGYHHTCAISTSRRISCWGWNEDGRLGNGSTTPAMVPTEIDIGERFVSVSAGGSGRWGHTCALSEDREVFCWGDGRYGQLGSGPTEESSLTPRRISGDQRYKDVQVGNWGTCGITEENRLYCWGLNNQGMLGLPNVHANLILWEPTPVTSAGDVTKISVGWGHSCAVAIGGTVACMGMRNSGRLGDGHEEDGVRWYPDPIAGDLSAVSVSVSQHSCLLTTGQGIVYCWGDGTVGGLGDGSVRISWEPVAVAGDLTFSALTVGAWYACAIGPEEVLYCWGGGSYGNLGLGERRHSTVPQPVSNPEATP